MTLTLACAPVALIQAESETPADTGSAAGGTTAEAGTNDNIGLGIFSRFPINISASVQGGYDDNVTTTNSSQQGSGFITSGIVIGYDLGNPRTNLTLSSNFGFTYYTELESDPFEPNLNLSMTLSHKVTARLTLNFTGAASYQTEPDFQYGFGTNRRAGNYFFTTDRFAATYAWAPRFATNTSYGIVAVQYDNLSAGLFEDRVEHTFGNEFRFLVWPTTNVIGEYRFQIVDYENVNRDSDTHYLLGGFDHAFSPRLAATFRGGAQVREYKNFESQDSPYFEGGLNYKLGKDTAVGWNFHYGIEEGDVITNTSRRSFRTGVQGKHDITARISASMAIYFYHDDYSESTFANPIVGLPPIVTPSFTEDSFAIDLALRYAVTRYLGVQAGYNHNEVTSGQVAGFRDYSRNRIWGGVNVSF
ncbi:MAG TPA: outer membrane beta-barrel protein [Chthoniobacterales bacterium]|nr:outer membrane beta-barrel protein [Chthoniobacterales bacterium]